MVHLHNTGSSDDQVWYGHRVHHCLLTLQLQTVRLPGHRVSVHLQLVPLILVHVIKHLLDGGLHHDVHLQIQLRIDLQLTNQRREF